MQNASPSFISSLSTWAVTTFSAMKMNIVSLSKKPATDTWGQQCHVFHFWKGLLRLKKRPWFCLRRLRWRSVSPTICSQQTEEVQGDAPATTLSGGGSQDDESNAHYHTSSLNNLLIIPQRACACRMVSAAFSSLRAAFLFAAEWDEPRGSQRLFQPFILRLF